MNLKQYFSEKTGTGVMSTSDAGGMVNAAVYSRPHIMEENTAAFIMRDRLTHKNFGENNHACFASH